MIPQNMTEWIWTFTGLLLALVMYFATATIIRQTGHNSEGSPEADRWEQANSAVDGFVRGDEKAAANFSRLLRNPETRSMVIETLSNTSRAITSAPSRLRGRTQDIAVLHEWVATALKEKDPGRRAHACEVVGTLRIRTFRGMILATTGDEDSIVKASATRALAVIDPVAAVGVLLGLMDSEGGWVADLLSDLLQRIPKEATHAVLQRAREWGTTPALIKLLSGHAGPVANDIMISALDTDDPDLRARAADAIHASTPDAVAALSGLLIDTHETVRLHAIRSLSRQHDPDLLMTLSSALSDPSRLIRFAAAAGIAETGGGDEVLRKIIGGTNGDAAEAAELALWRLQSRVVATQSEAVDFVGHASQPPTSSSSVSPQPVSPQPVSPQPVSPQPESLPPDSLPPDSLPSESVSSALLPVPPVSVPPEPLLPRPLSTNVSNNATSITSPTPIAVTRPLDMYPRPRKKRPASPKISPRIETASPKDGVEMTANDAKPTFILTALDIDLSEELDARLQSELIAELMSEFDQSSVDEPLL